MTSHTVRQLRGLSFGIGMFALMAGVDAFFRWRHLREMAPLTGLGSGHPDKWIWWELERAAWTDILGAIGLICVAIAVYLIGERVDALTPQPPEHPIWKELA